MPLLLDLDLLKLEDWIDALSRIARLEQQRPPSELMHNDDKIPMVRISFTRETIDADYLLSMFNDYCIAKSCGLRVCPANREAIQSIIDRAKQEDNDITLIQHWPLAPHVVEFNFHNETSTWKVTEEWYITLTEDTLSRDKCFMTLHLLDGFRNQQSMIQSSIGREAIHTNRMLRRFIPPVIVDIVCEYMF
jgi:hypothetical protein